MTRQEVYDKCVEKIAQEPLHRFKTMEDGLLKRVYEVDEGVRIWSTKTLLPQEAIDAIIDCAVEEAVMRIAGGCLK